MPPKRGGFRSFKRKPMKASRPQSPKTQATRVVRDLYKLRPKEEEA